MPTKIVDTQSRPGSGEINVKDLNTIIDDFNNLVWVTSPPNRVITKTSKVIIPVPVLKAFLDQNEKHEFINICFAVTLPDQRSCNDGSNISNQITVAILGADSAGNEYKSPGAYVITAGFKGDRTKILSEVLCCGNPR